MSKPPSESTDPGESSQNASTATWAKLQYMLAAAALTGRRTRMRGSQKSKLNSEMLESQPNKLDSTKCSPFFPKALQSESEKSRRLRRSKGEADFLRSGNHTRTTRQTVQPEECSARETFRDTTGYRELVPLERSVSSRPMTTYKLSGGSEHCQHRSSKTCSLSQRQHR